MLATATHDTKLGEDVRARVNAISELPDEWGREASRWMRVNKAARAIVDGEPAPDRNDEYRFYQALVGAWPTDVPQPKRRRRAHRAAAGLHAQGGARGEGPHELVDAESRLRDRADRIRRARADGAGGGEFLPAFAPFQRRIAALGCVNSLAQMALKIGSPGVPDFYQGSELWDLSLVDPDNRRPVDFALRERLLDEVDRVLASEGASRDAMLRCQRWQDGAHQAAADRRGPAPAARSPELFCGGEYVPLASDITVPGDVVAFARVRGGGRAHRVAPRLVATAADAPGMRGRSAATAGRLRGFCCRGAARTDVPPRADRRGNPSGQPGQDRGSSSGRCSKRCPWTAILRASVMERW